MEDTGTWFDRGVTLLEGGEFPGAITAFDKAITFNQSVKDAWFNRGVACAQIGKYQQALQSFDQTLLLDPDHENATKARIMVLALWEKQKTANPGKDVELSPRSSYVSTPVLPGPGSSQRKESIRNPWFAVIFSFLFFGWGQWYNGERLKGLIFLAVTLFSAVPCITLTFILKGNVLVLIIFMVVWIGILVYSMYDAYSTAEKINAGELGFMRKSRLFWLPVIILAGTIVLLIVALAFFAVMVFSMAGAIQHAGSGVQYTGSEFQHTKVVAATAQQTGAGFIEVTYHGGQDTDQVHQVVVTITDSEDSSQTQNMKQKDDTTPLEVGTKIKVNGRFIGKDHVVADAIFTDGSTQVILDTYV
jgi:TM2 domain-containing membrane protein YozV